MLAFLTRYGRRMTRTRRLAEPVISIGNIAVGGRAKTPMTARVVRTLIAAGERPAVLSRGYGRERVSDAPVVVRDADGLHADVRDAGDEPLMLAEQLDGAIVIVHRERARAGALAAEMGATVHVLDDGFQHAALARDIDIVMIDPRDLEGRLLPFGRLRERPSALARAHAVMIIGGDAASDEAARAKVAALSSAPQFVAARRVARPPLELEGVPVFLVTGIADGAQARRSIETAGWRVEGAMAYADHHRYTPRDVETIGRAAQAAGAAAVLTTEKDEVRLRHPWARMLPLEAARLTLDVADGSAFDHWLVESVLAARARQQAARDRRRQDGERRAS